jgi:alpha-aminoadipate carrier protein LysW
MAGWPVGPVTKTRKENETMAIATTVTCPECGGEFEAGQVEVGEIVVCPECNVELEVLSVDPIAVGLAPEEGEDWGE